MMGNQIIAPVHLERIPLGETDLQISPLGIGTWQWGDRLVWGYGKEAYTDEDLQASFDASIQAGINFFDTAEVYGQGRSETLLGRAIRGTTQPLIVATKFMPFPWRLRASDLSRSLNKSLQRLGIKPVDLYQIHFPMPPRSVETWGKALIKAVQAGMTRAVGVSNYDREQMQRMQTVLGRQGIPLASNQVRYSLLARQPEQNGVLEQCKDLGITLIAYSPLAQGLLTGKYTLQNRLHGSRRFSYRKYLTPIQPLISLMREIGQGQGGKTPAQVALNWVICKGAVPIPGAKNLRQAQENIGALGWRLTSEEVKALDHASDQVMKMLGKDH